MIDRQRYIHVAISTGQEIPRATDAHTLKFHAGDLFAWNCLRYGKYYGTRYKLHFKRRRMRKNISETATRLRIHRRGRVMYVGAYHVSRRQPNMLFMKHCSCVSDTTCGTSHGLVAPSLLAHSLLSLGGSVYLIMEYDWLSLFDPGAS